MGKVNCIFCRKTRARAKEHIWPAWLQEYVDGGSTLRAGTHYDMSGHPVSRRTLQGKALVLGQVCEDCNHGWMSKLEQEASAVLKHLLCGSSIVGAAIDPDAASVLARWAFKTAIVRNLGTNYRQIVPKAHFSELYDTRSIPDGTFIDLAIAPSHCTLGAVQSQTAFGLVTPGGEEFVMSATKRVYNIVIGVKQVLLRIAHLPMPGYQIRSDLGRNRRAFRLYPKVSPGVLSAEAVVSGLYDFEISTFFGKSREDGAI